MKHFLFYHNWGRWGEPEYNRATTNKNIEQSSRNRIWLITGKQRQFFLYSTFIVEKTGRNAKLDWKNWAESKHPQSFRPWIRIDRFRWFPRFKKEFGNFGLGFQPINDLHFISKLKGLMKTPSLGAEQFKPTADHKELEEKTQLLLAAPRIEKPKGQKSPKKVEVKSQVFKRDPKVIAYVLREADGKCELCNDPAPFKNDDGEPFLEVHHVRPLADGGSDRIENAVGICPNCHRSLHQASDSKKRREKLYRKVKRLKPE